MSKKTKEPQERPEQDPMLGDKTPAYVEWVRDNEPEEYLTRYAGRLTHLGLHPAQPGH